jgi:hypothetical protein
VQFVEPVLVVTEWFPLVSRTILRTCHQQAQENFGSEAVVQVAEEECCCFSLSNCQTMMMLDHWKRGFEPGVPGEEAALVVMTGQV